MLAPTQVQNESIFFCILLISWYHTIWLSVFLPQKELFLLYYISKFSTKCTEKDDIEEWDSQKFINLVDNFANSSVGK